MRGRRNSPPDRKLPRPAESPLARSGPHWAGGWLLAPLVPVLILAGCAAPAGPAAAPAPSAPAPAESDVDLQQLRLRYGLPDCPTTDPAAEAVEGGLPQTALPCLGSDVVVNLAGLERRPMVVNFWAQWCGPCREEAPFLRELSAERTDVGFLGINYNDPQADWAIEFAGLVEWDYPQVQDMDKSLQASVGIPGLPVTVFVDENGVIVDRHIGVLESKADLAAAIDENFGAR
ncbi:TlpA family protein disulfide reductase [Tessaracoccus sp. OS52]|uniref:TlpA family protein disulfide reductase n=1 Tax=Tessaracoccus sp. OS52 TaxID=2886691 RepID=UPI001D12E592|nr:TlpA disulfide reductase family protein [Tessaracoccus sp. OS52]MCC2594377.1 TlpA family protein disulfide reductase [Tessaracoccus sp. OS52]